MAEKSNYAWRRDKDGQGVWEHRGKVAVAGLGHSPVDRRWDGVSMDKTIGAYSMLACQKAMDEAGVTKDQIDGVICCDSHIATFIIIEDGRLNRRMPDQPYNLAMVTLDEDPSVNFYSNLPGTPPYKVPVGAPVEVTFEEVAPNQLIHEWRVV